MQRQADLGPYLLEDLGKNFDDLYDRVYYRVEWAPPGETPIPAIYIHQMRQRASPHRERLVPSPSTERHVASLTFGKDTLSLGTVWFVARDSSHVMSEWLTRSSMFGGSLKRKFIHEDKEYRWSYRSVENQEWTCTNSANEIVSSYNDEPPDRGGQRALAIHPPYLKMTLEILTSFIIMRHIKTHNLSKT